jgi:hypothetical protein
MDYSALDLGFEFDDLYSDEYSYDYEYEHEYTNDDLYELPF